MRMSNWEGGNEVIASIWLTSLVIRSFFHQEDKER